MVFITGLPRTGTTAWHRLLNADPAHQWLEMWLAEATRPRQPWSTVFQGEVIGRAQLDMLAGTVAKIYASFGMHWTEDVEMAVTALDEGSRKGRQAAAPRQRCCPASDPSSRRICRHHASRRHRRCTTIRAPCRGTLVMLRTFG